ncbi:hypothetical protein O6H91_02G155300 [Diphasiastrum complanatum]|uniref:Uncharacterized protein n=2 Tax=Diphasiastrum complanatum TaxID=34168 RepID=A0ACC2EMH4_DIPCM|nr:hypothetical protein O6H91_Y194400 [Diphasiastrum complanatum]KAJ7566963.1 hypothetical protein O6H91_02G125800 [Diphasiastrum complanatum]KAJ7567605.1 hypothetical protein O6H91_02G155300 [Diphasiastrum complanatum]
MRTKVCAVETRRSQRWSYGLLSFVLGVIVLQACVSAVSGARSLRAEPPATQPMYTNHPVKFKDGSYGRRSGPDECGFKNLEECAPPSDTSFRGSKRLVPTGPNPLHNR